MFERARNVIESTVGFVHYRTRVQVTDDLLERAFEQGALPPPVIDLFWYKYIDTTDGEDMAGTPKRLLDMVTNKAMTFVADGKWRLQSSKSAPGTLKLEHAARLAIRDYCKPKVCGDCSGIGVVMARGELAHCQRCEGLGFKAHPAAAGARVFGMTQFVYSRRAGPGGSWAERVALLGKYLGQVERQHRGALTSIYKEAFKAA